MARTIVLVMLLTAACVAAGCAQLGPVYYKESQEYSFHPPAGWRYNPTTEEITIFVSHHVKGRDYRPNLSVVVDETDLVLEEYMENQRTEWLPKLPGFHLVEEFPVRYGVSWRMVYDFYNPHYNITLRALQQLVQFEAKIYAITYIAEKKLWNKFRGMFYDSLETFKFGREAVPIGEKTDAYARPELTTQ